MRIMIELYDKTYVIKDDDNSHDANELKANSYGV